LHLSYQLGRLEEVSQCFRAVLGTLAAVLFVEILIVDEAGQDGIAGHSVDLHEQHRDTVRDDENDLVCVVIDVRCMVGLARTVWMSRYQPL
jgi:hypothetical protein